MGVKMIKKLFISLFFFLFINADDIMIGQKQNALYIQNLIESEDKIAKNFEKYILTELKIPTLEELRVDEYLGKNFSLSNRMGDELAFSTNDLKLKYAISKKGYTEVNKYITLLYNRDLYRDNTYVYFEEIEDEDDSTKTIIDTSKSYVKIVLKTDEAKTIFNLLASGEIIDEECTDTLVSKYCNKNEKAIRWYNTSSKWIQYDKKFFENGNVSTTINLSDSVSLSVDDKSKFNKLSIGAYIIQVVEDQGTHKKYVKLYDDTDFKYIEVK